MKSLSKPHNDKCQCLYMIVWSGGWEPPDIFLYESIIEATEKAESLASHLDPEYASDRVDMYLIHPRDKEVVKLYEVTPPNNEE